MRQANKYIRSKLFPVRLKVVLVPAPVQQNRFDNGRTVLNNDIWPVPHRHAFIDTFAQG